MVPVRSTILALNPMVIVPGIVVGESGVNEPVLVQSSVI